MQIRQRTHDEKYHPDIFFLSYPDRLKHIAFHYAKYVGRLARDLTDSRYGPGVSSGHTISKTLTDTFIMTLSASELFNQNIEQCIRKIMNIASVETEFQAFASIVVKEASISNPAVAKDYPSNLESLLIHLADYSGTISKACDSLDHMEGIDRDSIMQTIARIMILLLLVGNAFQVNYEVAVPARLKEIEDRKLL